jgi:hypothetical protein
VITERKSCEQSGVALHFPPQSKNSAKKMSQTRLLVRRLNKERTQ